MEPLEAESAEPLLSRRLRGVEEEDWATLRLLPPYGAGVTSTVCEARRRTVCLRRASDAGRAEGTTGGGVPELPLSCGRPDICHASEAADDDEALDVGGSSSSSTWLPVLERLKGQGRSKTAPTAKGELPLIREVGVSGAASE